jgi:hypothetical protein
MTVSAEEGITGAPTHELKKLVMGIVVLAAVRLAAPIFFMKSRRELIKYGFILPRLKYELKLR